MLYRRALVAPQFVAKNCRALATTLLARLLAAGFNVGRYGIWLHRFPLDIEHAAIAKERTPKSVGHAAGYFGQIDS